MSTLEIVLRSDLAECPRDSQIDQWPGRLVCRCVSVTYAHYAPSARLASRPPRTRSHVTNHEDTPLAACQEMPRQGHVVVDRIDHFSDPHMLLVGVGDQHGARAEQEWFAPGREEGDVGSEREGCRIKV